MCNRICEHATRLLLHWYGDLEFVTPSGAQTHISGGYIPFITHKYFLIIVRPRSGLCEGSACQGDLAEYISTVGYISAAVRGPRQLMFGSFG